MSLARDVQAFFDFYLGGGELEGFKGKFPGIRRRQPATVGDPPEYEPTPMALEEFESLSLPEAGLKGLFGDFDPSQVRMMDVCAAEKIIVLEKGAGLEIVLLWVTSYPASEFLTATEVQPRGRVATADVGQPALIVLNECLNRLWAFAASELAGVPIDARVVECPFEKLEFAEFDVRKHG